MCLRENFGKWPTRLLERCETKYGATAVATKTSLEPELRSGMYCVEKLAEVFERKNLDGAVKMTAKHWRRLMVECGNVVATPLLRILPQKNTLDPLHISAGVINHLLDEIRKEIRKKLDVDDELFASAKSALKEVT